MHAVVLVWMNSHEKTNCPAMTRPEWMSIEGRPIYSEWTQTLLAHCDRPEFWRTYKQSLDNSYPGVARGAVLGADQVIRRLLSIKTGTVETVDRIKGISQELLPPHKDDILQFTSAADFLACNDQFEEAAIIAHAHDGLRFAIKLSAGLVNDVFLEHTAPANEWLEYFIHLSDRLGPMKDSSQIQELGGQAYQTVKETMGPWWDSSHDVPQAAQDPRLLERAFLLRKLAFLRDSLQNQSLIDCLEELSVTGFAVLGEPASHPVEHSSLNLTDEDDMFQKNSYGWQQRAGRFGLDIDKNKSKPHAVLLYDIENDKFSVRPETISYLHNALKVQNQEGLGAAALRTAGNLGKLTRPISRGCPVTNTGSIEAAALFTSKAFAKAIEYQNSVYPTKGQ